MSKSKDKGTAFETKLAKELAAAGVPSQRQPMSGALADWPGDVMADPQGKRLQIECKHHKTISHYDRLEGARELLDGVLVETPSGRSYWMEHSFMLALLRHSLSPDSTSYPIRLGSLKMKVHPKNFEEFIQGCDFLVVKPNHKEPRWWMSEKTFWQIVGDAFGAQETAA